MRRLFVFGCSYTAYSWPTYADMLGGNFDEVQNWGFAGLGNRAIAERLSECHIKNNITKDDVVIVQWSSHIRNDFYHMESLPDRLHGWKTCGSIFNYHNVKLYDRKWVETFFFEPAYIMHTLNFINLAQNFLDGIGCDWYMTSIGSLEQLGADMRTKDLYGEKTKFADNLKESTKTIWDVMPELAIYKKLWNDRPEKWLMPMELYCQTCPDDTYTFIDIDGSRFQDLHPSVTQHLNYIRQELKDKLQLTDEFFDDMQKIADNIKQKHTKFKTNKIAFEFSVAQCKDPEFEKITWPTKPQGF